MTPLMWACNSDDRPMIELLLARGVDPNARNREGRSAASVAGPACAALLAARGPAPALHPVSKVSADQRTWDQLQIQELRRVVAAGDTTRSAALLQQGAPANAVVDDAGQSVLMLAPSAPVARLLVTHGADVNWGDAKGWTALHHAVTRPGTEGLVRALLEAGADVHRRIENGQTALLLANVLFVDRLDPQGGKQILRLLVGAGADINAGDRDGETLLHIAAYNDSAELAQACLDLGGDLQRPNKRGETPRRLAQRLKAKAMLQVLAARTGGTPPGRAEAPVDRTDPVAGQPPGGRDGAASLP
jgi:ankyrin repeat protein